MKRKIIIAAIIVAAVGLIVSLLLIREQSAKTPVGPAALNGPSAALNSPVKLNPPVIQTGTVPGIKVDSPQPAGNQVTIAKVSMPIHGFVVIREIVKGVPGAIAGASNVIIFPTTENLAVVAKTVAGKTYVAEIHADGNKNGIFDAKNDPPFLVGDQTVSATFKVK